MIPQPRDQTSGRFSGRERTAPEQHLAIPNVVDDETIFHALRTITRLFTEIAALVARGEADFDNEHDPTTRYAVGFVLIQLGEHAKRLGRNFTERHPEPRYSDMAKQRDLLAHHLEVLNWKFLWRTASKAVPRSALAHAAVQEQFESRFTHRGF